MGEERGEVRGGEKAMTSVSVESSVEGEEFAVFYLYMEGNSVGFFNVLVPQRYTIWKGTPTDVILTKVLMTLELC